MFFVSLIEIMSIGSLLPIFSIIFNEKYLPQVNDFFELYNFVNIKFESHDKLIFFSLAVLFCIFTLKNTILLIFLLVSNKIFERLNEIFVKFIIQNICKPTI